MSEASTTDLVDALRAHGDRRLVVLTGAGISAASGLPVFRGRPDAIWERDVMEMGMAAMFHHDPAVWWEWFIHRFAAIRDARPNEAHRAIVELENIHRVTGGRFTLVTQNFDTLHEDAGSDDLIKIHGTITRLRCSRDGCRNGAPFGSVPFEVFSPLEWVEDPRIETLPRCEVCGAVLRAHVLLFDEYYSSHADYRFADAVTAFDEMDLLLVIGTSLAVGITHLAFETAVERGVPVFRIDHSDDGERTARLVKGSAEEVVPKIVGKLAI